ncbi:MAG: hypothetical protein QOH73_2366 [Gaiellaceae bacterium]|jgi:hypothetical protein|nr:hypothetical protein [Gaiellaceae bacterium]
MGGDSSARTTVWETAISAISTLALATTQGAVVGMTRHSWAWGIAVGIAIAALFGTMYALRLRANRPIAAIVALVGPATLALLLFANRLIGWQGAIVITVLGTALLTGFLLLARSVGKDNELMRARQEAADARRQHGA